jgi:hypothetical protein
MKWVTSLAFALTAALTVPAFAADKAPADKLTPQQQKLSDCAKDAHAKSLKGDAYKSYMSTCTKGSGTPATNAAATKATATSTKSENATAATADKTPAADAKDTEPSSPFVATKATNRTANAQQQKMKTCASDAKAKGLKGADRRNYMSTCLKGDGTTPAATTPPAAKN